LLGINWIAATSCKPTGAFYLYVKPEQRHRGGTISVRGSARTAQQAQCGALHVALWGGITAPRDRAMPSTRLHRAPAHCRMTLDLRAFDDQP
jgi:hypothetical protein